MKKMLLFSVMLLVTSAAFAADNELFFDDGTYSHALYYCPS
ncbi:MAG: hypothetical protein PHE49_11425 [bacterium]|nr:hypothetical protein [bacterium]